MVRCRITHRDGSSRCLQSFGRDLPLPEGRKLFLSKTFSPLPRPAGPCRFPKTPQAPPHIHEHHRTPHALLQFKRQRAIYLAARSRGAQTPAPRAATRATQAGWRHGAPGRRLLSTTEPRLLQRAERSRRSYPSPQSFVVLGGGWVVHVVGGETQTQTAAGQFPARKLKFDIVWLPRAAQVTCCVAHSLVLAEITLSAVLFPRPKPLPRLPSQR